MVIMAASGVKCLPDYQLQTDSTGYLESVIPISYDSLTLPYTSEGFLVVVLHRNFCYVSFVIAEAYYNSIILDISMGKNFKSLSAGKGDEVVCVS